MVKPAKRRGWRRLCGAVALAAALQPIAWASACEFAAVKKQIDDIIDRDKDKGAVFRREVAAGSDSIEVMNQLVSAPMREQIDICRYFVAEYLAKRGFPPAH